jgi:CubicO group peptidase (beta-lactamase class C family)
VEALRQVDGWGAENVAVAVLRGVETIAERGEPERVFRWASITKPVSALATLIAAEEGTVDLEDAAGPEGATVRHLLAHASGLPFEGTAPIARVGQRRIYSNAGFDALGAHVAERTGMQFADYVAEAVLGPLGMQAELLGRPGAGISGSLDDLVAVAVELREPRLVAHETLREATSVQFPGLAGVLPDFGRFDPMDWGLGIEIKGTKSPHWTGSRSSARTYGHFGGSGTFLWLDPDSGLGCACLTDREFGAWAIEAWPRFADAVVEEAA